MNLVSKIKKFGTPLVVTFLLILGVPCHSVSAAPFVDAGGQVQRICATADKVFAAVSATEGISLVAWDVNGVKLNSVNVDFEKVTALQLSLDAQTLICAGSNKGESQVTLFDVATLHQISKIADVPIASVSMTSKWIACAGEGVQVGLNSDLKFHMLPAAGQAMAAFSPDGTHLLVATPSQTTCWSSSDDKKVVMHRYRKPNSILAVGWDGDEAVVVFTNMGHLQSEYYKTDGTFVHGMGISLLHGMGTSLLNGFVIGINSTIATYSVGEGKIIIMHGQHGVAFTYIETGSPLVTVAFGPGNVLYTGSGPLIQKWSV